MRRLTICSAAAFCLGLFVLSRVVAQSTPTQPTTDAESRLAVADQRQLLGAETANSAANPILHTADLKRESAGKSSAGGNKSGSNPASATRPRMASTPARSR
jgi:hypothetical protein